MNLDKNDLAKWNLLERPNSLAVGQILHLYERPGLPEVEIEWDQPGGTGESWTKRKYRGAKWKVKKLLRGN